MFWKRHIFDYLKVCCKILRFKEENYHKFIFKQFFFKKKSGFINFLFVYIFIYCGIYVYLYLSWQLSCRYQMLDERGKRKRKRREEEEENNYFVGSMVSNFLSIEHHHYYY